MQLIRADGKETAQAIDVDEQFGLVVRREDGTVEVHVAVYYPEMGTCDMAYRYYLIETEED